MFLVKYKGYKEIYKEENASYKKDQALYNKDNNYILDQFIVDLDISNQPRNNYFSELKTVDGYQTVAYLNNQTV
jgi:hypothetical protein